MLAKDAGRRVRSLAAALDEAEGHHAVEGSAQALQHLAAARAGLATMVRVDHVRYTTSFHKHPFLNIQSSLQLQHLAAARSGLATMVRVAHVRCECSLCSLQTVVLFCFCSCTTAKFLFKHLLGSNGSFIPFEAISRL